MLGGKNKQPLGYTILEVMIFMAISGLMFVMAAAFVQGKQARSEFRQGINALNTNIRQVINDVDNGFDPSSSNFNCTAGGSGAIVFGAASRGQGENLGCTFIGKVIQFDVNGSNSTGYNVYSIAGRQYKTTQDEGTTPSSFSEVFPQVIYAPGSGIDQTQANTLEWGLKVTRLLSNGSEISGIGFFNSFGNYDITNTLTSGSQSVLAMPINGTGDKTKTDMISVLNSGGINDSAVTANPNITACIEGGDHQFATLNIGGTNGQRLTTTIHILNAPAAGC
jgi:type II secretory pathway pseudopilin PulG